MIIILLVVLVFSGIVAFSNNDSEVFYCDNFDVGIGEYTEGDLLFQGPVLEGYDECLFRLTGRHEKIK